MEHTSCSLLLSSFGYCSHCFLEHRTNEDLVHKLVSLNYIKTINIEKAFRCVDRGLYYPGGRKPKNYDCLLGTTIKWQSNLIHLPGPLIYATALRFLELEEGNKFLNIGSNVGYFSTMAGFLLGLNGINHGIEINQQLIDYAYKKLQDFKSDVAAIDYYDFCEPIFIQGNAFQLLSTSYYDRVYCGGRVPPDQLEFVKSLINIGGILVIPLDRQLLKIMRVNEDTWKTVAVFPLDLDGEETYLEAPEIGYTYSVKFPSVEPLSLKNLCRSNIRSVLRNKMERIRPKITMKFYCWNLYEDTVPTVSTKRKRIDDHTAEEFSDSIDRKIPSQPFKLIRTIVSPSTSHNKSYILNKSFFANVPSLVDNPLLRHRVVYGNPKLDDQIGRKQINKFSQLLMDRINLLPISNELKRYLNYLDEPEINFYNYYVL